MSPWIKTSLILALTHCYCHYCRAALQVDFLSSLIIGPNEYKKIVDNRQAFNSDLKITMVNSLYLKPGGACLIINQMSPDQVSGEDWDIKMSYITTHMHAHSRYTSDTLCMGSISHFHYMTHGNAC